MSAPKIVRSDTSAREQLDWQFDFLRASLERYEAGQVHEALRLAAVLRILCHDQGGRQSSVSLLEHLQLKQQWDWLDTTQNGGNAPEMFWGFLQHEMPVGLVSRYAARLGSDPATHRWIPFKRWWGATVLRAGADQFSRRDLVLFVSNQDGGAHVDPELTATYNRLSRANSLGGPGWAGPDPKWIVRTPVWEAVRQIAFELEATAHKYLSSRIGDPLGRQPCGHPKWHLSAVYVTTSDSPPVPPLSAEPER